MSLFNKSDMIVCYAQILLLYGVIVACIINLSIGNKNSDLWTMLLTSGLGYMMPSPAVKPKFPNDHGKDGNAAVEHSSTTVTEHSNNG